MTIEPFVPGLEIISWRLLSRQRVTFNFCVVAYLRSLTLGLTCSGRLGRQFRALLDFNQRLLVS